MRFVTAAILLTLFVSSFPTVPEASAQVPAALKPKPTAPKKLSVDQLLLAGRYSEIKSDKTARGQAAWAFGHYYLTPNKEVASMAKKAHEAGDHLGTFVLMLCHQKGIGLRRDRKTYHLLNYQLRTALEKVKKPDALQLYMLSYCHAGDKDGKTRHKDLEKLNEILARHRKQSAESMDRAVKMGLAQAVQDRAGAEEDLEKRFKLYLQAAELGLAAGKRFAGLYLVYGDGIKKDVDKGMKLTMEAARGGDVYAMVNMAMFHHRGIGVKKDPKKSREWAERAVKSGHWYGKIEVGYAKTVGMYGYKADKKGGLALWQEAVSTGNSEVLTFAAGAYYRGFGVEQSFKQSAQFAEAAYRQGSFNAAQILAVIYGEEKVKADKERAAMWAREAAKPGFGVDLLSPEDQKKFYKSLDAIDPFALKIK